MRLLLIFFPFLLNAQVPGCTDPQALNYDSQATLNDGSCIYASANLTANLIGDLPGELPEASGVYFYNNALWSHNDSGSEAKLFVFDPFTANIEKEVFIGDSQVDWEELTYSDAYFYIGDFGNNSGDRTDLKIIRFSESELSPDFYDTIVQRDTIFFSYPDQSDFTPSTTHDFDCEAFFVRDNSCHLFSKNRSSSFLRHYSFPALPGTYVANLVDSVELSGQVTAAAMDQNGVIILIGYTPPLYASFALLLWDYEASNYFSGNKRILNMGNVLVMGQQEGVCFDAPGHGYIVSEAVSALGQAARYFEFDVNPFVASNAGLSAQETKDFIPFPNPVKDILFVRVTQTGSEPVLISCDGRRFDLPTEQSGEFWQMDLSTLSPGYYMLHYNGVNYTIRKE